MNRDMIPTWDNTLDARNYRLYPTLGDGMEAAKKGNYQFFVVANKGVYDLNCDRTDYCVWNGYLTSFP